MCLASVFFAILGRRLPPPLASLLPSSCNGNKPQSPPSCAPPVGSAHTVSSHHQSVSLPTSALRRSDPTALLLLFRERENLKFILFLARSPPETPVGGPSQKKVESGTREDPIQSAARIPSAGIPASSHPGTYPTNPRRRGQAPADRPCWAADPLCRCISRASGRKGTGRQEAARQRYQENHAAGLVRTNEPLLLLLTRHPLVPSPLQGPEK